MGSGDNPETASLPLDTDIFIVLILEYLSIADPLPSACTVTIQKLQTEQTMEECQCPFIEGAGLYVNQRHLTLVSFSKAKQLYYIELFVKFLIL